MERSDETLPADYDPATGIESNLGEIARRIFTAPPQLPHTFGLGLEDVEPVPGYSYEDTLHQILTYFLLRGIQARWGDDVRLSDLTPEDINNIRQYMASIGFKVNFEVDKESGEIVINYAPAPFEGR